MTLPASLQGRLSLPLIGSPMFIISQPELVIAQCRAGIVGAFPSLKARPSAHMPGTRMVIVGTESSSDIKPPVAPVIGDARHGTTRRVGFTRRHENAIMRRRCHATRPNF